MTLEALIPEQTGVYSVYEIFIKHLDKNDEITKEPSLVKSTYIRLYERKIEKLYEASYVTEDGYTVDEYKETVHLIDPASFYDTNITDFVQPILLRDGSIIDLTISNYIQDFYSNENELNDKEIDIQFVSSDVSEDYELREGFITILDKKYININIETGVKFLTIDEYQYDIKNLNINNSPIKVNGNVIFILDTVNINNCTFYGISNDDNTRFSSLTFNGNRYTLHNNTLYKNNFIHFIFDSATEEELKWRQSKLDIMNLTVNIDFPLKHLINSFIRVFKTYDVNIVKTDITTSDVAMKLINIRHARDVEILNFDVKTVEYPKSSFISLDSVGTSLVSNINVSSDKPFDSEEATKLAYAVNLSNTSQLAEHKFTNFDIKSIGLIKTSAVKSKLISFINCSIDNFMVPFNISKDSYIPEIKFLNCKLLNIDNLTLDAGYISIVGSELTTKKLNIISREKLYLSDPNIVAKESLSLTLIDDSFISISNGLLESKDIKILGDGGKGIVNMEGSRLEAKESLVMEGLQKISLSVGRLIAKTIHLHALRITNLSSNIRGTILKNIKLLGAKIDLSEIRISLSTHNRINVELEDCSGDIQISSETNRPIDISITNSVIKCLVKYSENCKENSKVTFNCIGDSIGSSIYSSSDYISIHPNVDNDNFNKLIPIDKLSTIKSPKEYIVYGQL